jgi:hypothetical protein
VSVQLGHEGLAESHDFRIGLAVRIKVGAAFAAADRQTGQAVLEDLFKAEELDDARIDVRSKSQTAFVGSDCTVEFISVALVDLDFAVVVNPDNAEGDSSFGLGQSFEQSSLFIFGVLVDDRLQGSQYFFYGLVKFDFARVLLFAQINALKILVKIK